MSTHLRVPLKNLRFGHEAPVHPSNARVTGRLEGIEGLAANIFSRGLIEDLIVFDDGVPEIYFVADGNRSLAALRLVYGTDSSELIDCKQRPAEHAFEDSLAVAVMAHKLHPIDEYEGYAKLRDDHGKTPAEIAQQYGLSEREVGQVLALGGALSPNVRNLWRHGKIRTDVAKALTLAGDHKTQDDILERFAKEEEGNLSEIRDYDIKQALKIGNDNSGVLVEFIGVDAYVTRGGKVTRDLFGTDHKVSDPKLAKTMAAEKLKDECSRLVQAGWGFAVAADSVRNVRHDYGTVKVEPAPTDEENAKLDELNAVFNPDHEVRRGCYECDSFAELVGPQQWAYLAYQELERAIQLRAYTPKMMASAGCFVGIDTDGFLEIEFGRIKPKQKEAAAKVVKEEKKEQAKSAAKSAAAEGKPAPESAALSQALLDRLNAQLTAATRDALADAVDTDVLKSPLSQILAKLVCSQINVNGASVYIHSHGVVDKLGAMREALPADIINAAIAKRFDAEDYFSNAPKALVIKAIAETINPDEARKAAAGSKAELAKFALANISRSGWLPKELRTSHYAAPAAKKAPAAPIKSVALAKPRPPGKPDITKPAASTKKAVKKTAKKPAAKKTAVKKKKR